LHNGHRIFTDRRRAALIFLHTTVAPTRTACIFDASVGPPMVFSKGPEIALILDEKGKILFDPPKSSMISSQFASVQTFY
jgi:hypothetical protein